MLLFEFDGFRKQLFFKEYFGMLILVYLGYRLPRLSWNLLANSCYPAVIYGSFCYLVVFML